jgi:RNA polymerase sigma-70 factor (ECF subfamily)
MATIMSEISPTEPDSRLEQGFVQLLTSHQRSLYVYILTLVHQPTDADEVLQNTNVVLCAKAADWRSINSFAAWSQKIAYFEVLAFRKRNARSRLLFAPDVLESLAHDAATGDDGVESDRRTALSLCMEKLAPRDRELIGRRYAAGGAVERIASEDRRPASSVYRSLERIRLALLNCIRRRITAQERSS